MKEFAKRVTSQFRTLENSSKASKQLPISTILETNKNTRFVSKPIQGEGFLVKSKFPLQRVLNIVAAGKPALVNAAYITANSSPRVNSILGNPNIIVNIAWANNLGPNVEADTTMDINWNDGVPHGPISLFNINNAALVSAINFSTYVNHHIIINIRVLNPPLPNSTWQGSLMHELEAHTELASKIDSLIKKGIEYNRKGSAVGRHTNIPNQIVTSMTLRDVDSEHYNYAQGAKGAAEAMTATVLKQPTTNSKVAVLLNIGENRMNHLIFADANLNLDRINFNKVIFEINKWITHTQNQIPDLTLPQEQNIQNLLVNNRGNLR